MSKSLTSLDAHTADIIQGRRLTQDARFKPLPPDVERIDEVLRGAIDFLHQQLKTQGFKSAQSKLSLSRKVGKTNQILRLIPGASNLSGVSVEVSLDVSVKSASLKRWTATEGTKYAREHLWIKQLGYLSKGQDYFKWQLVDRSKRDSELNDLLAKIQLFALSAFEAWSDNQAIAEAVFRFTEMERIDWLVETALWSENSIAAAKLVELYLQSKLQEVHIYEAELRRFRTDIGIQEPQEHFMSALAFLVARHSLEVSAYPRV